MTRRIPSEGLEAELWALMALRWGVSDADSLDLPLLRAHPLVKSRAEETLVDALSPVLQNLLKQIEPPCMVEALEWEFALAAGSGGMGPRARFREALERSQLVSKALYSQDRQGPIPGQLVRESRRTRAVKQLVKLFEKAERTSAGETAPSTRDEASLTRRPRCIQIGRLKIDHAIPVATCDQQQSSMSGLLLEFEGALRPSRPDPKEWPLLNAQLLPVLEEEARRAVVKFENDPILELVYIEHRPETASGAQRYKVGVAESRYYQWAATANSLDRDLRGHPPDLADRIGYPKLREAWRCDPSSLGDLTRLPAPSFIGVCVVVIAEGQIILLKRRPEHHVANTADGIPAHFMGEGMLPKDLDAGRYSPEQAARRGCYEELGIGHTHLTLIPTGLIIDTKRWQPLFCFVGECDLTIPRLKLAMEDAPHKDETGFGEIAARLPWTVHDDHTLAVLTGEDPVFSLASNHAQAALLNALYYIDGREAVRDRLGA
jgi:hypothetical protein